jgi:hypothetical protein
MGSLTERLSALRRQAGLAPAAPECLPGPAPAEPPGELRSVRAEIDRLAAVRARTARTTPARPSEAALAASLGGGVLAEGLIVIEHRLPLPAAHGRWPIEASLAEHLESAGIQGTAALFLDTETTGLAGGTGTTAFLVGAARVDGETLVARQYLLARFCGEPALLAELARFGAGTDALVTFNGKCFDLPLLAARYRLCGLPDPFAGRPHADLLHPVRRAFGRRWPDCRLATVEGRLLGFARAGDLPSAEVPLAWFRWLRQGQPDRLPAVLDHNRWDLLSLAALLPALRASYAAPVEHGADLLAVARHRGARSGPGAAHALLAAHQRRLDARGLLQLARLAWRQGHRAQALSVWRELAARGHVEALEHLAKHAEHVERDLPAALALTRRLMDLEPGRHAHRHRCARLAAKAGIARPDLAVSAPEAGG